MTVVYGMRIRSLSGLDTRIKEIDGGFDKVKTLADGNGLAVDPANLPKQIKWMDGNGAPPGDFDRTPWTNVSERAKQAIEELEKSVHQFIPVEYLDQRSKHLENRYWFNTCNRIDSVDREHTNMIFHLNSWHPARDIARRYPDLLPEGVDPSADPKLVFNLNQIGDVHLWHDRYLGGGRGMAPFMSQTMHDHLQAKGLTGIEYGSGKVEAV